MEKKKISLNGLEKVLSPKEMKNVKGGSDCILKKISGCTYFCCLDGWQYICQRLDCDAE